MHQMFPYFGSKKRMARQYPPPSGIVIEPFCGAAGYAVYYQAPKALLCDIDADVVATWQFIIDAGKRKGDPIRELPLLAPGERIPEGLSQGARGLMGFWCVRGVESPRKALGGGDWVHKYPTRFWGEYQRERLAKDSVKCATWEVVQGNYSELKGERGTWFIDPPYEEQGKHYKHPFTEYSVLADFCRSAKDSVIVCEERSDKHTPSWLPFRDLYHHMTTQKRKATEMVWMNNIGGDLFSM